MHTPYAIDPHLSLGVVTLKVRDLDAQTAFYQDVIGLRLLAQDSHACTLGVTGGPCPVLRLAHAPEGCHRPDATGLFHLALVLPSRAALGTWAARYTATHRLNGAGDHGVSVALYLDDPEGNGIEVYWDRPRAAWPRDRAGDLQFGTHAVDLASLTGAARDDAPDGLPPGTRLGHIHLRVNDTQLSHAFYHTVLGFEVMSRHSDLAFFGAGGYHHHIGANTWQSRGAPLRPSDALGLARYELLFSDAASRDTVVARLESAGVQHRVDGNTTSVTDPAGLGVVLGVAEAA
ncbi:MAG: VOC family protein [Pseudomonadota bacterium]